MAHAVLLSMMKIDIHLSFHYVKQCTFNLYTFSLTFDHLDIRNAITIIYLTEQTPFSFARLCDNIGSSV